MNDNAESAAVAAVEESPGEADVDTVVYPEEYYAVVGEIQLLSGALRGGDDAVRAAMVKILNRGQRFVVHEVGDEYVGMLARDPERIINKLRAECRAFELQMEQERAANIAAARDAETDGDADIAAQVPMGMWNRRKGFRGGA